jgi:TAZ zinc finger
MMLHVRDCPGTTAAFDVCPFPWCRKVKHLLYHLVSCSEPTLCAICSPANLSPEMRNLARLNKHRLKRQRERLLASNKPGATACPQQTEDPDPDPSEAKPSTVTSSNKPTTAQRGAAHSKPKAAASRSKARGAVLPAERPKSGKPAANASQMQALDPTAATTVQCDPPDPIKKSVLSAVAVSTTPTPGSAGSSAQSEQPALPGPTNPPLPVALEPPVPPVAGASIAASIPDKSVKQTAGCPAVPSTSPVLVTQGGPAQQQPAVPSPLPVAATEAEDAVRHNAPQPDPSLSHSYIVAATPTLHITVSSVPPVPPPGAATPLAAGLALDVAPPTTSPVIPPGVDEQAAQKTPTTLDPHRQAPPADSSQVGNQPETIPKPVVIVQDMASSPPLYEPQPKTASPAGKLENSSVILPSGASAIDAATRATKIHAKVGSDIKTDVGDEQCSPDLTAELPAEATKKGSAVIPGSVFKVESLASMANSAPAKVKVEDNVNGEAGEDCKLSSSLPSATTDEQTPGATDLGPRSCSKEDITKAAKEPIKSC